MTPFPSPPSQTTRASFPAWRFPEQRSLALEQREDFYIAWPLTPPPSGTSPPATLCPVDDLLVLPGGTRLPRLRWWLCHHLARARKVIPRYVSVGRASSPERPDSSLERPRWSPVTLRGVDQPTVHANPKCDIGCKRSTDGCAHSPDQDSGSGNQALRIASGSYTCPVLQRFGTGSACSVCFVPFEFPRQGD
jgi:hypothetical protein